MDNSGKTCEKCGKVIDSSDGEGHAHESSKVCRGCGQIASDDRAHGDQSSQEQS